MDPAAMQVLQHVLEARRLGQDDHVSLPGADLRGAELIRADLVGADFSGTGLDHANLAGAKLTEATLMGTLLRWADLGGADLTAASLCEADLSWARLEGASLAGADLRGADISGVVGAPATVVGAKIDHAMMTRSELSDGHVIQLWSLGAVIEDLDRFSERVQRACVDSTSDLESDIGATTRRISDMEVEGRLFRAKQDSSEPPSMRLSEDMIRFSMSEIEGAVDSDAPLSLRELNLTAASIRPEMLEAPGWKKGDELMGVTLGDRIGSGNVASVWGATDADGNEVAVKLFDMPRAKVGLLLSSYRRGVMIMNRLTARKDEEAGVVKLRCVSLNKLGIVMERAANGSSADLPALGWSEESAVTFFAKLCQIVKAAHDAGALHRCIKPDNVLLDDDLDPILTDFDMVDLPTLASESKNAGGYAAYAAPEELLGSGTQSPTADIYSLGRYLSFLLTGEKPTDRAEVPVLSDLADCSEGLVRIVRKCTMRTPEARYQFVEELLDDLARYDAPESVGIAGDASAEAVKAERVSSLSHQDPWLSPGNKSKRAASIRPKPRKPSSRPPPRARRRRGKPEPEPTGMSQGSRQLIGALGLVMILVALLVIAFGGEPTASMRMNMRFVAAFGTGAASFMIGDIGSKPGIFRLLIALCATALGFVLDLPSLV